MSLRIKDQTNFGAGILMAALALGFIVLSLGLEQGTLMQMGPGAFPLYVSVLALVVGIVLVVLSCRFEGETLFAIRWRPLIALVGAILFFSLALEKVGLLATSFATIIIGNFAMPRINWIAAIASGAVMAALVTLIFVTGLGLNIPLLPQAW